MLTNEEFIDLVSDLNDRLSSEVFDVEMFYPTFCYVTEGYSKVIQFDDTTVYHSCHDNIIYDDEPEYKEAGDYKTQIINICKQNLKQYLKALMWFINTDHKKESHNE